ncbi:hypothetical protein ES704_01814 [subsurface metagenome]
MEEIESQTKKLAKAIESHYSLLQNASIKFFNAGVSSYPIIIAYIDGVDWRSTFIYGSTATLGWNFAITDLEYMKDVGAISERSYDFLKQFFRDPEKYFHVFNAEIPTVNLRPFPIREP